jgi:hypothetical protein
MEGNPGRLYHVPQEIKASRQSPVVALCAHNRANFICLNNPTHRLICAQMNKYGYSLSIC